MVDHVGRSPLKALGDYLGLENLSCQFKERFNSKANYNNDFLGVIHLTVDVEDGVS
jgi:hypothetical protein